MKCQEIEAIVTELARNSAIEVDAQGRAVAHLRECRECNGRLTEEKRLTEGLLAWAAVSMAEQAPPRVEEKLRAAFRRRPAPVRHGRGWLAFAAAGSIAAAILLFKLPATSQPKAAPPILRSANPEIGVPVVAPVKSDTRRKPAIRRPRRRSVQPEIATEFLPVAVDDGWTPLDGGRLVRVKLPSAALGVFGLPLDTELGPERVQADVMLSNDGVLRAIRFVR
jgi:hypothetical protein